MIQNPSQLDQIMIEKDTFTKLHNSIEEYFASLNLEKVDWSYHFTRSGEICPVYSYVGKGFDSAIESQTWFKIFNL